MNKSELKKRILESLTPDEASKVDVKYKEIYAGMVGKNPLKMKKYDNPDKVAYGRAINLIKKESAKLSEKLGKDADLGDHIEDFQKSDAPQFQGKSKKKINQMAQAAFLKKEEIKISETADSDGSTDTSKIETLLGQVLDATKKLDKSQDDTEDDVEELDASIDYLAAAITDRDPIDIAVDQATFGRLAKPTKEEKTLEEIDAMMEEEKTSEDKLERIIKSVLKKEGGAAGIDPLKKAVKGEDTDKDFDIEKFIKKLDSVKKHRDGDYILKEGHSLSSEDLDVLKNLASSDDISLRAVKVLKSLIKSNIKQGDLGTKVDEASGMEKAKKNMDMYKDKNRLEELVKAALMKETSTDKYDDNPALKGKQSELPDGLQKSIIKKSGGKVEESAQYTRETALKIIELIRSSGVAPSDIMNALGKEFGTSIDESFDSLVKKVDKSKGYTKKEAEKVAGSIAAKKRAGAGKGPTAKQKKRMAETILKELKGNVNEMAGEDLELKSLAKKMIPTLKKLGFEVEYSTDTSMKTLKNAGDKFVALRVQDGMLGAHIPFKAGLDAAKEIQKEIQKSLGNKFEYKLTKSKRGPGLEFYTILIRNK